MRGGDDCQVNGTRRAEASSSVTVDSGSLATVCCRALYSELDRGVLRFVLFFDRRKSLFILASRGLHIIEFSWTPGSPLVNCTQISHLKPGISEQRQSRVWRGAPESLPSMGSGILLSESVWNLM